MRRNFRPAILALLLVALVCIGVHTDDSCASTHRIQPPPLPVSVGEKIVKHSLDFRMPSMGNLRTVGGGTFIKHKGVPYALTANHVWNALVEKDESGCIAVCHEDDCVCVSEEDCVSNNETEDWALIRLPRKIDDTTPAKMSTRTRPIGTATYIVGCPDGVALMVTHGIIAAYISTTSEPFPHYMVDGYAYYGSSGGGLFTRRGVLIGIVTAIPARVGVVLGFPFPIENPNLVIVTPLAEVDFPTG
tara:strand:+ start:1298 stop:2035 length:738 start_codon:yes stop_codon:yes gene_type:complete